MYNHAIININDSNEMKAKHENSIGWKRYTSRVAKSPFIKRYLMASYNGVCQFCNRPIRDHMLVHHMDYDHECTSSFPTVKYDNPTEKRPGRTVEVPDCERCSKEEPNKFNSCVCRLVPVHGICNMIISKIYGEQKAEAEKAKAVEQTSMF